MEPWYEELLRRVRENRTYTEDELVKAIELLRDQYENATKVGAQWIETAEGARVALIDAAKREKALLEERDRLHVQRDNLLAEISHIVDWAQLEGPGYLLSCDDYERAEKLLQDVCNELKAGKE